MQPVQAPQQPVSQQPATRWRHQWSSAIGPAVLLLLSRLPAGQAQFTALGDWVQGIATNYGGPVDQMDPHSPSFGTLNVGIRCMPCSTAYPYWSVVGISPSNPYFTKLPGNACGACFEVQCLDLPGPFQGRCITGPGQQSIVVMVSDECPQCEENHLDIQALTYAKIAPIESGRIDIQYRQVECVPPADMKVNVDNNVPGGWVRLYVEETGGVGAVSSVSLKGTDSWWIPMVNEFGAAWQLGWKPAAPLDLNIVAANGQTVTALSCLTSDGELGQMPTNVQFSITDPLATELSAPIAGSSPASAARASPAAVAARPAATSAAAAATGTPLAAAASKAAAIAAITPPASTPAAVAAGTPSAAAASSRPPVTAPLVVHTSRLDPVTGAPVPLPPAQNAPNVTVLAQVTPAPVPPSMSKPSGPCKCTDMPSSTITNDCQLQKDWGKCSAPWMLAGDASYPEGFCQITCNRCKC